jgi:hypothetical protein
MVNYALPDLPYDYSALEPSISGQIMELHHDKHHAAYVAGANTTLDRLVNARESDSYSDIVGLEKTLAFNISGHVRSRKILARSMASRRSSPRRLRACRDRVGELLHGSRSVVISSSSRSTITRARCQTGLCRCSSLMRGSTRTTSSTRMSGRIS